MPKQWPHTPTAKAADVKRDPSLDRLSFPPSACGDAYHPLIATTLCDHIAIRHRVDALLSGPEPAPSALHGLGARLREHVRMEERKLFPLIERSVPSAALVALAVALQQAER